MDIKITGVGYENWAQTTPAPVVDAATERVAWQRQIAAYNQSIPPTPAGAAELLARLTPSLNGVAQPVQWPSKYENPLTLSVEGNKIIGTQKEWVAPPPPPARTPAASDAWRDAEPGAIISMAGVNYEVIASAFGNMIRRLKNPPVATPVATVAEERSAMAEYIRTQLAADDDEKIQAALMAQLAWLSKRP